MHYIIYDELNEYLSNGIYHFNWSGQLCATLIEMKKKN
jgi:hypothetical protein